MWAATGGERTTENSEAITQLTLLNKVSLDSVAGHNCFCAHRHFNTLNNQMEYSKSIERLRTIMDELRAECPWDRKQTIHTLQPQTLEEVYELSEVITNENWKGLKEELGDLLLHIMFYSKIGSEQQQFTFDDVVEGVCNKLINRHPHIYGALKVNNEEEVKQNWEKIKQKEGKKRMRQIGNVEVPQEAFLAVLKLDD